MENKAKAKGDANGPSVNETILSECHPLHVEAKTGVFMWLVDEYLSEMFLCELDIVQQF